MLAPRVLDSEIWVHVTLVTVPGSAFRMVRVRGAVSSAAAPRK